MMKEVGEATFIVVTNSKEAREQQTLLSHERGEEAADNVVELTSSYFRFILAKSLSNTLCSSKRSMYFCWITFILSPWLCCAATRAVISFEAF